MLIEDIQFADGELIVKLNPIFESLRQIKNSEKYSELIDNVRTLKNSENSEVLEYLTNRLTLAINSKVRTLKTLIIPNKKAPEGANFINGADSGIRTHAYRNHNPRS